MNEKDALLYAAKLLEAHQGTAYHPDVDYSSAVEMLKRFADDDYLRSGFEDFSRFGEPKDA
jgi:hypothetical protein